MPSLAAGAFGERTIEKGPSTLSATPEAWFHFLVAAPAKSTERDVVEEVVRAAISAPSLHNSQPWRFSARTGDSGATLIELRADHERDLPVADREGRELCISCGAALEFGRIAARALGRAAALSLLPDPAEPDLVGRIELGPAEPPEVEELRWSRAIPSRHTARDPFDPRPLRSDDRDHLRASAALPETWMRFVESPDDEVTLAVLLARADDVEAGDAAYAAEVSDWRRGDESSDDGLSPTALGTVPVRQRASSFRLRNFALDDTDPGPAAADEPPPPEHPSIVILGTVSDDRAAWLLAGRALARLLLEATSRGIGVSPMTQVLEVPSYRVMLAHALNLVGAPQMLLRLGYGLGGTSPRRRPLSEVLSVEL